MANERFQGVKIGENIVKVYDSKYDEMLEIEEVITLLNSEVDKQITTLKSTIKLLGYQLKVQDRIIKEYEENE